MTETTTIKRGGRFEVGRDGTFEIAIGNTTLTFQIVEGDQRTGKYVQLISPKEVDLTAAQSAEAGDIFHAAISAATQFGIPRTHTLVIRQFKQLPDLKVELYKATTAYEEMFKRHGDDTGFVYVLETDIEPSALKSAKALVKASGLNAGLALNKGRWRG